MSSDINRYTGLLIYAHTLFNFYVKLRLSNKIKTESFISFSFESFFLIGINKILTRFLTKFRIFFEDDEYTLIIDL